MGIGIFFKNLLSKAKYTSCLAEKTLDSISLNVSALRT
jgi:hypothetical protein